MGKIGGTSDAEVIRILRKEPSKANDELQSYRGVHAENARLRKEIMFFEAAKLRSYRELDDENERLSHELNIFKETAKPTEERGRIYTVDNGSSSRLSYLSDSISTTLVSTPSRDSSDHSSPQSRKLNISQSVAIEGEKWYSPSYGWYQPRYVSDAGEPKELPARVSRNAVLPRFMHPTHASEARVHDSCLDYDSQSATRKFLKKGKGSEKYLTDKDREHNREEERRREQETELDVEFYLSRLRDERDRRILVNLEPKPIDQETYRLDEAVNPGLASDTIHSAVGVEVVRQGLDLFKESFHAAAQGPHLARCSGDEMEHYLNRISIAEMHRFCPADPQGLRSFLSCSIRSIRNPLAHPAAWRFQDVRMLDNDLQGLQRCLIMMGDGPRARKVRALRDELTRAAQERAHLDIVMEGSMELPFDESEEDWDPSFPEPAAWKGMIEDDVKVEMKPGREAEANNINPEAGRAAEVEACSSPDAEQQQGNEIEQYERFHRADSNNTFPASTSVLDASPAAGHIIQLDVRSSTANNSSIYTPTTEVNNTPQSAQCNDFSPAVGSIGYGNLYIDHVALHSVLDMGSTTQWATECDYHAPFDSQLSFLAYPCNGRTEHREQRYDISIFGPASNHLIDGHNMWGSQDTSASSTVSTDFGLGAESHHNGNGQVASGPSGDDSWRPSHLGSFIRLDY
ncbi:hypothetical protein V8F33_008878 [Rhypophila sp. PSN 637]